jgi:hypothetical protein
MSEWKKVKLGDICEITAGGDKPQVVSNCMVLNTNKRAVIHCPFIVPFVSLIIVTQHAYISKCDGNFY